MSTNEKHAEKLSAKVPTFDRIYDAIDTIEGLDSPGGCAIAQTPGGIVSQIVQIYSGIKPLLVALSTVSLIPDAWRGAVKLFVTALDALVTISPDFKAGKDL